MTVTATKPLTAEEFQEFVNLPENRDRNFELERGEVVEMSRPGIRHGVVCANIARILGNFVFARKKGCVCGNDTGLVVGRQPDTVRGPDVILFDENRNFDTLDVKFGSKPPALAVEVLSPNDLASKVMKRIAQQLDFGTGLVWLVDPEERTLTVFRPGTHRVVNDSQEIHGEEVLPDLRFMVAEIFAMPGE